MARRTKEELQDIEFGRWLKNIRCIRGLSLLDVGLNCDLSVKRIYELENGIAKKGITSKEVAILSKVYNVDGNAIVAKVLGGFH